MLVNRVGDFGLALGIFAIFLTFKSIDYATVFAAAPTVIGQTTTFFNFEVDTLNLICLLLFVGAVGKSAQIGLHTWLPDAMEGPTSSFCSNSRSNNGYRRCFLISTMLTII